MSLSGTSTTIPRRNVVIGAVQATLDSQGKATLLLAHTLLSISSCLPYEEGIRSRLSVHVQQKESCCASVIERFRPWSISAIASKAMMRGFAIKKLQMDRTGIFKSMQKHSYPYECVPLHHPGSLADGDIAGTANHVHLYQKVLHLVRVMLFRTKSLLALPVKSVGIFSSGDQCGHPGGLASRRSADVWDSGLRISGLTSLHSAR